MIKFNPSKKVQSLRNLQKSAISHLNYQNMSKMLNLKKKSRSRESLRLKRKTYTLMILILMLMRVAKKENRPHLKDQPSNALQLRRRKKIKLTLNL